MAGHEKLFDNDFTLCRVKYLKPPREGILFPRLSDIQALLRNSKPLRRYVCTRGSHPVSESRTKSNGEKKY
jgi:hypothetical protein